MLILEEDTEFNFEPRVGTCIRLHRFISTPIKLASLRCKLRNEQASLDACMQVKSRRFEIPSKQNARFHAMPCHAVFTSNKTIRTSHPHVLL